MQNIIANIMEFIAGEARSILIVLIVIVTAFTWDKLNKSEKFHQWIVRLNPGNEEAHLKLGSILKDLPGREEKAEHEYRQSIRINPHSRRGYQGLFLVQERSQKNEAAEQTIRQLMELFPDDPVAYVWKGGMSKAQGAMEDAEKYYSKAISLAPRYSFVYDHYGHFLLEQNRMDEAEAVFANALRFESTAASTYAGLTRVYSIQKKHKEAEKLAREFIRLYPHDPDTALGLVLALGSAGKVDQAINICRQVTIKHPKNGKAYLYLGVLYTEREQFQNAATAFQKAIEFAPDDFMHYYLLARLQFEQFGNREDAERLCRLAIQKSPDFVDVYQYLGFLLKSRPEKRAEAEKVYRKIIALKQNDATAHYSLATLLFEENQLEEAQESLQKMIEFAPEEFTWLVRIASLQKRLGKTELAKENIRKSRALIVENSSYWYNLCCLESIDGNVDVSFACLEKAAQEKGFDTKWAWEDPDLRWIRNDPRFVEIVGPKLESKSSEN